MRQPTFLKQCIFIGLALMAVSVGYVKAAPRYLSRLLLNCPGRRRQPLDRSRPRRRKNPIQTAGPLAEPETGDEKFFAAVDVPDQFDNVALQRMRCSKNISARVWSRMLPMNYEVHSSINARRGPAPLRLSVYKLIVGTFIQDMAILLGCGLVLDPLWACYRGAPSEITDQTVWASVLVAMFYLAFAHYFRVYSTALAIAHRAAFQRAALGIVCAFIMFVVITTATKTTENYSRLWLGFWIASSLMFVYAARALSSKRLRRSLAQGAFIHTAVSIGLFCEPISGGEISRRTAREVRTVSNLRFDDFGGIATLPDLLVREGINQVYISVPWQHIPLLLQKLDILRHLSTKVEVLPAEKAVRNKICGVSLFGERLSFCAIEEPIFGWDLWLKRAEDVVVGSAALLLLAPVLAIVALAIRIETRGPVFFRQLRVGFNGKTFKVWKFRSMYHELTDHHAAVQTRRDDPRVTRVGRFIRRTSIDELPQLFNVLEGTMSIVGPRPHALSTKADGQNLEDIVDYYAVRHRMKPGITGWAQVNGFRGELDTIEKLRSRVDFDLYYINNWTFWLDLKIMCKTTLLCLYDRRAY